MAANSDFPTCPHCGSRLQRFELPEAAGYDEGHHAACFNDDCPYFRRGWVWMFEQYGVKSSYRYRVDPSGTASPLPVWSKTAIRDRILEDDVDADPGADVSPEAESGPGQGGEGI